jgi:two-component system, OmpR family, sensor kinase
MTWLVRPRSLRFRILALTFLLCAVAVAIVNVVAVATVRSRLQAGIDAQLKQIPTVEPAPLSLPDSRTLDDNSVQFLANYVITELDPATGAQVSQLVGPLQRSAPLPELSTVSRDIIAKASLGAALRTVGSVGSSGYRYRLRVLAPGSGQPVLVIAVSLADMRATVHRLSLIDAGVSAAVLLSLLAIGIPVTRLGLRPLADVELTARHIASGSLSSRAPHEQERTEVGSLARSFNQMLERIQEAFVQRDDSEQQLRRFVADASHELRTPLTVIRAYAELFRQGALTASPEAQQAAERIESEATAMGELVEDLLLLARLDQHPEPRHEPVDLTSLLAEAVQRVSSTAPSHELSIVSDPAVHVAGDPLALRRAVTNLLRNAVLHTPPGTCVLAGVREDGDAVTVWVSDNGPGMSPEVQAHAFERFFRGDASRIRHGGSGGLGLSIVSSVVAAHGGSVELTAAPGVGTTVVLHLPG